MRWLGLPLPESNLTAAKESKRLQVVEYSLLWQLPQAWANPRSPARMPTTKIAAAPAPAAPADRHVGAATGSTAELGVNPGPGGVFGRTALRPAHPGSRSTP